MSLVSGYGTASSSFEPCSPVAGAGEAFQDQTEAELPSGQSSPAPAPAPAPPEVPATGELPPAAATSQQPARRKMRKAPRRKSEAAAGALDENGMPLLKPQAAGGS